MLDSLTFLLSQRVFAQHPASSSSSTLRAERKQGSLELQADRRATLEEVARAPDDEGDAPEKPEEARHAVHDDAC